MASNANRPRVPTVITPAIVPGSTTQVVSSERVPLKLPTIGINDIAGPDGKLDAERLVRIFNLIQSGMADGTLSSRSDPLGMKCIVQSVSMTSGSNVNIKHTLGEPWKYATILSASSGSASCVLTRTSPAPSNIDQSQYASVTPTGTGTYDVCIYPG